MSFKGDSSALRLAIRRGEFSGLTTGHAPGHVQANLVVLPRKYAADFIEFCKANAFASPLLAVSEPGDPALPALGSDIDIRTDLGAYEVHSRMQDGSRLVSRTNSIGHLWQDDWVSIAIGCWFSMEDALREAGVRLRHVELGIQGPLFRTNIAATPAGIFSGPLVVSMRPFHRDSVETVRRISSLFPDVHGAPFHVGEAGKLGIVDIASPDFGEQLIPENDEIPMFWGCGLTASVALTQSAVDTFITHSPGRMLVTDRLNIEFQTGATL